MERYDHCFKLQLLTYLLSQKAAWSVIRLWGWGHAQHTFTVSSYGSMATTPIDPPKKQTVTNCTVLLLEKQEASSLSSMAEAYEACLRRNSKNRIHLVLKCIIRVDTWARGEKNRPFQEANSSSKLTTNMAHTCLLACLLSGLLTYIGPTIRSQKWNKASIPKKSPHLKVSGRSWLVLPNSRSTTKVKKNDGTWNIKEQPSTGQHLFLVSA